MAFDSPVLVVGAAIVRQNECLAAKRGPQMSLAGKWEFPGGKVEKGEAPAHALAREIREELGIDIEVGHLLASSETAPAEETGRGFVLEIYRARHLRGKPVAREHEAWGWFDAGALAELDWARADRPALAAVLEELRQR